MAAFKTWTRPVKASLCISAVMFLGSSLFTTALAEVRVGECRAAQDFRTDIKEYIGLFSGDRIIPTNLEAVRRAEEPGRMNTGLNNLQEMETVLSVTRNPSMIGRDANISDEERETRRRYSQKYLSLGLDVYGFAADRVAIFHHQKSGSVLVMARAYTVPEDGSAISISERTCVINLIQPARVLDFRTGDRVEELSNRTPENPDLSICRSEPARLVYRSCDTRQNQLAAVQKRGLRPVVYGKNITKSGEVGAVSILISINLESESGAFHSVSDTGIMGEHFQMRQVILSRNFRTILGMPSIP